MFAYQRINNVRLSENFAYVQNRSSLINLYNLIIYKFIRFFFNDFHLILFALGKRGVYYPHIDRVSPIGEDWGDSPHYPKSWLVPPPPPPPTVLTPKCRFCNFRAVFGHFAQIVPPISRPHLGNPDG